MSQILCDLEKGGWDSISDELLTRANGALSILGSYSPPLLESVQVLFRKDGRDGAGIILSSEFEENNKFSLILRPVCDVSNLIVVNDCDHANALEIRSAIPENVSSVFASLSGCIMQIFSLFQHCFRMVRSSNSNLAQTILLQNLSKTLMNSIQCSEVLEELVDFLSTPAFLENLLSLTSSRALPIRIDNLEMESSTLVNAIRKRHLVTSDLGKFVQARNEDSKIDYTCTESVFKTVSCVTNNLLSFGKGDNGRLGLGNSVSVCLPSCVSSFADKTVVDVSCFSSHVLALTSDGKVWSWGKGDDGRLGHGSRSSLTHPQVIDALKDRTCRQVSAGLNFSCVLDDHGRVWAFGSNANGQIGNGSHLTVLIPHAVKGALESEFVTRISCGGSHVLALTSQSSVYSWGKNQFGQLGLGHTNKVNVPTRIEFPAWSSDTIVKLASGWEHSLAVSRSGAVYSWGAGYEGTRPVCGHGSVQKEVRPRIIEALTSLHVVEVSAGWDHSFVITIDGELYSWGSGSSGALGHGTTGSELVPRRICGELLFERCVSVAGGQDHSVVATDQGNLYTFGSLGAHLGYSNASQTLSPRLIRSGSANEASCKVVAGDKCTFVVTNALPSFAFIRSKPIGESNPRPEW